LGPVCVSGRSLVPNPPCSRTPFILALGKCWLCPEVWKAAIKRHAPILVDGR